MASEHSEAEIAKQIAEDELARKQEEFERLAKPPEATLKESRESGEYEPPLREDERRGKPGRFQFGAGDTKPTGQLLMAIGISVLLSFLIISQFMVSKGDFETNLNAMNATVSAAVNDMNQKVNAMSATVSGLSGTISSQINTTVTQATSTITGQITTISGQITELDKKATANAADSATNKTSITDLLAKITTLEDQVEELESRPYWDSGTTTSDGTTTTSGDVTIHMNQAPDSVYSQGAYQYWINVTNNSGVGKKVYIEAIATISGAVPSGLDINTTAGETRYIVNSASPAMTGGNNFDMTFIPSGGVLCSRISGVSQGYVPLGPGANASILIQFVLVYDTGSSAGLWTVNFIPIATSW